MSIDKYDDEDYLEELKNEKYKYKYKKNRLRDSFAFEDLLDEEQRKQILKYTENGR